MFYDYFTGDATVGTVATRIADALISAFGHIFGSYTLLVMKIKQCLFAVYDAWVGNVSWSTMGSIIVDLATQIFYCFPATKAISTIVSILWDLANIL